MKCSTFYQKHLGKLTSLYYASLKRVLNRVVVSLKFHLLVILNCYLILPKHNLTQCQKVKSIDIGKSKKKFNNKILICMDCAVLFPTKWMWPISFVILTLSISHTILTFVVVPILFHPISTTWALIFVVQYYNFLRAKNLVLVVLTGSKFIWQIYLATTKFLLMNVLHMLKSIWTRFLTVHDIHLMVMVGGNKQMNPFKHSLSV
mmetsp:Transcript_14608/g.21789  ORF Transcript_14608/g.21789 Transcript_14608/m.21789 type:complete len:204 (+) Transcript_14608:307-918(+)